MIILGVDPALQITGYGVIENTDNRLRYVSSGTVQTKPSAPLEKRLDTIYSRISGVMRESKPACLVLEKVFVHHSHTTTAFLLGQARGTIVLAAAHQSIPVIEYAATQVKKAVVGRGHATKQQVQRMVVSVLGMTQTPKYFDVTDALALALAYTYHNRNQTLAGVLSTHRR